MDDRGRGLEFLIGEDSIVVAAALVDRVVEVDLSRPPPLARPWVGGFGVSEGLVFVAVDLAVGAPRNAAPTRVAGIPLCVLLDTGKRKGLRWALRVTRTVGFVDVRRCPRPSTVPAAWPAWIAGGMCADKSVVALLDVAAMAKDFDQ